MTGGFRMGEVCPAASLLAAESVVELCSKVIHLLQLISCPAACAYAGLASAWHSTLQCSCSHLLAGQVTPEILDRHANASALLSQALLVCCCC